MRFFSSLPLFRSLFSALVRTMVHSFKSLHNNLSLPILQLFSQLHSLRREDVTRSCHQSYMKWKFCRVGPGWRHTRICPLADLRNETVMEEVYHGWWVQSTGRSRVRSPRHSSFHPDSDEGRLATAQCPAATMDFADQFQYHLEALDLPGAPTRKPMICPPDMVPADLSEVRCTL